MTFTAKLNRAVHHAARIRWFDHEAETMARIKAKSAANNLNDGPAIYTLG
jgi:hypothetical protein